MIHIINRHCRFSVISKDKKRPDWYSREKCFQNLIKTLDGNKNFKLHILFDGNPEGHFLQNYSCFDSFTKLSSGSGAASFVDSVNYAIENSSDGDLIYFLEDDYLHWPNWTNILEEGATLGSNTYFTLYDAPDKYPSTIKEIDDTYKTFYTDLVSKIVITKSCHWRTVPSTTDTFIISRELLVKYKQAMIHYSSIAHHSLDHARCLWLGSNGLQLWSCIPGYSAHITLNYESPTRNWGSLC